jgi:hypothetical protein
MFASLKILTNSRHFSGSRIRIFPPPPPNETGGNSKGIGSLNSASEVADNHPPQSMSGFLYAATSSLKRDTGRIFTVSKCFHRSKPKLHLLFPPQNLKTIGAYIESTDLIFKIFKKIILLVTQSLQPLWLDGGCVVSGAALTEITESNRGRLQEGSSAPAFHHESPGRHSLCGVGCHVDAVI